LGESPLDMQILSLGCRDWILFGEVEQRFRDAHSLSPREDAIAWIVRFAHQGWLIAGNYDGQFIPWTETGKNLELKMRWWLRADPVDPLGPGMTLMFELTKSGREAIPNQQRF
jgi:hypothetical protein